VGTKPKTPGQEVIQQANTFAAEKATLEELDLLLRATASDWPGYVGYSRMTPEEQATVRRVIFDGDDYTPAKFFPPELQQQVTAHIADFVARQAMYTPCKVSLFAPCNSVRSVAEPK